MDWLEEGDREVKYMDWLEEGDREVNTWTG
jgi:hypothetical protein